MNHGPTGMRLYFSLLTILLTGLFLRPSLCLGANETAISDPEHRVMLNGYVEKAKQLEDKNLNRFSMEVLYQYDKVYDSLYTAEKRDTLSRIARQFDSDNKSKSILSDTLDIQVTRFSAEKEELRQKYFGLLRKSVIALVLWLVVVTVILYLRTKAMKKYKLLQAGSEASLATYQSLSDNGQSLLNLSATLEPVASEVAHTHQSLIAYQEDVRQKAKSGEWTAEQAKDLQGKLTEVVSLYEKQDGILHALKGQSQPESETRIETDVNNLCRHYLELAVCGMIPSDSTIKVTTDFEKRLPRIKVFPRAIGHLLMNLLANSIQSLQEKSLAGDKTYKPTLAVSTRVLPRFIQIRIKDNGTGIHDAELQKVLDYFYSLHPPEKGAGLGLAEANRIMKEVHQGEISIESDNERGTDVYLKFFTGNEKV
jgi:signal transduction histidine kinase